MNCLPTIAIALLLLSFTAGMWLLYKTQKENLGVLFKIAAWFIIVISLGSMACCSVRCILHGCKRADECHWKKRCEAGMQGCMAGEGMCGMYGMHGGMHKRMMIIRRGEDACCMMHKGCCREEMDEACMEKCREGEKDCCRKGKEKCEMKMEKDSVIMKK